MLQLAEQLAKVGLITEGKENFLIRKRKDYDREILKRKPNLDKLKELEELIGIPIYNNGKITYRVM